MKTSPNNQNSPEGPKEEMWNRRKLLKALTKTGGAVIVTTLLPDKWVKPIIEVGMLPAHAQTSSASILPDLATATPAPTGTTTATPTPTSTLTPTPPVPCTITTGTFNVTLTWNTNANLDLHVIEPCSGIDVAPVGFGGPIGDTIQHLGDNTDGSGPEMITQKTPGEIYVGTYVVHPGHISGPLPTTATMTITTDIGDTMIDVTFTASTFLFSANVTFPGGLVTSVSPPSLVKNH